MKDIIASLEMAKKLEKSGWTQHSSLFYWMTDQNKVRKPVIFEESKYPDRYGDCFDAPTAEEILKELPEALDKDRKNFHAGTISGLNMFRLDDKWTVRYSYRGEEKTEIKCYEFSDTLADASAQMWIYLKKNDMLTSDA